MKIPRKRHISLSAPKENSSIVILWIAPFQWLNCQPEAVSGCAGAGREGEREEGKDLPEVLWFQAVPFVFLEDDSVLAGCCSFCLVSFISVYRAPYSHCTLSSQRAGFMCKKTLRKI